MDCLALSMDSKLETRPYHFQGMSSPGDYLHSKPQLLVAQNFQRLVVYNHRTSRHTVNLSDRQCIIQIG
jgi:hypothetical protein